MKNFLNRWQQRGITGGIFKPIVILFKPSYSEAWLNESKADGFARSSLRFLRFLLFKNSSTSALPTLPPVEIPPRLVEAEIDGNKDAKSGSPTRTLKIIFPTLHGPQPIHLHRLRECE
jgi:hypothetical protein